MRACRCVALASSGAAGALSELSAATLLLLASQWELPEGSWKDDRLRASSPCTEEQEPALEAGILGLGVPLVGGVETLRSRVQSLRESS